MHGRPTERPHPRARALTAPDGALLTASAIASHEPSSPAHLASANGNGNGNGIADSGPPPLDGARPPAKRARKAINCEPCRASKLKCDRGRPCSSCVLRGTVPSCYHDAHHQTSLPTSDPYEPSRTTTTTTRVNPPRIDPAVEIARLRASLGRLESYVLGPDLSSTLSAASHRADLYAYALGPTPDHSPTAFHRSPKREASASPPPPPASSGPQPSTPAAPPPGALGRQSGGLYAGPTSAASFIGPELQDRGDGAHGGGPGGGGAGGSQTRQSSPGDQLGEYDRDLLAQLPHLATIEQLFEYYFSYCKWIFRYVNRAAFESAWNKYKSGQSTDRLALATACVILSVATYYLPELHPLHDLLAQRESSDEEAGERYYYLGMTVLDRHLADSRRYSLELVELHLVRCHYLMLSKKDGEAIWAIKGDLVTIGTAMGLHRDPGKWSMPLEAAERRRWAWSNTVYLDRLQCWLFGRPLSISARHFDTELPSHCPPSLDPTGRHFVSHLAMFKLGQILAAIIDDAVSLRPVPHANVMRHDRALEAWFAALPVELQLDEFGIARGLGSASESDRRRAVQSIIIRAAYHHYRFTLHRPYASKAGGDGSGGGGNGIGGGMVADGHEHEHEQDDGGAGTDEYQPSLDIAVSSADRLINVVCSSHSGFLSNTALAVPGHMSWGAIHIFSASMFFSFQLIARPRQPGAPLFRANIARAMDTLRAAHGVMPVADKSYNILQALGPLYADDIQQVLSPAEREQQKATVLRRVQTLAFPYHDSPVTRRPGLGGGGNGMGSTSAGAPTPALSSPDSFRGNGGGGVVPPPPAPSLPLSPLASAYGFVPQHQQHQQHQQHVDVLYGGMPSHHGSGRHALSPSLSRQGGGDPGAPLDYLYAQQSAHFQPLSLAAPHGYFAGPHAAYGGGGGGAEAMGLAAAAAQVAATQAVFAPAAAQGALGPDQQMVWGAAMGFDQGEWSQFMDSMQRPMSTGRAL